MILLDTSILSLAYRRQPRRAAVDPIVTHLRELIRHGSALGLPGIVLQEVLSGVRTLKQFDAVRGHLMSFQLCLASEDDHVRAAQIYNNCLGHGTTCSAIDALIAAQAIGFEAELFSSDRDFPLIAQHCDLALHKVPA